MIFSSSGPDLALHAQAASLRTRPPHLICARCPSPETALGRPPRGNRGGREKRNVGKELQFSRQRGRASSTCVGGLLLGFRPSFKPRHMGWQMSVPLQGRGVAGLLTVRGACPHTALQGAWLFGFERVVLFARTTPAAPFSPCSLASSVVRYLGDRPRCLRYRLRLADSVDVTVFLRLQYCGSCATFGHFSKIVRQTVV